MTALAADIPRVIVSFDGSILPKPLLLSMAGVAWRLTPHHPRVCTERLVNETDMLSTCKSSSRLPLTLASSSTRCYLDIEAVVFFQDSVIRLITLSNARPGSIDAAPTGPGSSGWWVWNQRRWPHKKLTVVTVCISGRLEICMLSWRGDDFNIDLAGHTHSIFFWSLQW